MIHSFRSNLTRKNFTWKERNNFYRFFSLSMKEEPIDVPVNGTNTVVPSTEVHYSTTPSGIQVVSDGSHPTTVTLGISINSGSASETFNDTGIHHLYSKMAFHSTSHRSDLRLYRDIENIGGKIFSTFGRENLSYRISVLPDKIEEASEILAESLITPRFVKWDVDNQKEKTRYDYEVYHSNPFNLLYEKLHSTAFYDNSPLGKSLYTSPEDSEHLNETHLKDFYNDKVNKNNVTIIVTGVEHSEAIGLVNNYFNDLPASDSNQADIRSNYYGGEYRMPERNNSAYITLGFQNDIPCEKSYLTSKLLNILLDSNLKDCDNATSFNFPYKNQGLIGYAGIENSNNIKKLIDQFVSQMKYAATKRISSKRLEGFKNSLVIEISSKNKFEWLSKHGKNRKMASLKNAAKIIDTVTAEDIVKFASGAIKRKPTFVSRGNLHGVPRLDEITAMLKN